MHRVDDGVRADASSRTVLTDIGRARAHAAAARRFDAHWVRLESGVQTVELSLRRDDAFAANQGIRVTRDACAEVRSTTTSTTSS